MWYHNDGGSCVDTLDGASATQHRRRTDQSTNGLCTGVTYVSMGARFDPWLDFLQTNDPPDLYEGDQGMANQGSCPTYHEDGSLSHFLPMFANRDQLCFMRIGSCGYQDTRVRANDPKYCDV